MVDEPKWRTGKLCYIEIPAVDVARSAEFYRQAFGWTLRQPGLAETEAETEADTEARGTAEHG